MNTRHYIVELDAVNAQLRAQFAGDLTVRAAIAFDRAIRLGALRLQAFVEKVGHAFRRHPASLLRA